MMSSAPSLTAVFVGSDSLLIECAEVFRQRGHRIAAIVSNTARVRAWADERGLPLLADVTELSREPFGDPFDHLFAITHLKLLPDAVLRLPRRSAINFHDGPLPRYAGLNAPAWALLQREREYGITFHVMTADVDAGDILKQSRFPIHDNETALSLNTRCFAQAIESFGTLLDELAAGSAKPVPQTRDGHTYFGRHARPEAACLVDWNAPSENIAALTRALDFGPRYPNTLGCATLSAGGRALLLASVEALPETSTEAPGTLLSVDEDSFTVACGEGQLRVRKLRELSGQEVTLGAALARLGLKAGSKLDVASSETRAQLTELDQQLARAERFWVRRLSALDPLDLPYCEDANQGEGVDHCSVAVPERFTQAYPSSSALIAAFGLYAARLSGRDACSLAVADSEYVRSLGALGALVSTAAPLEVGALSSEPFERVVARFEEELAMLRSKKSFLRNVGARYPALSGAQVVTDPALLPLGVSWDDDRSAGSSVTLCLSDGGPRLRYARSKLSAALATRVARELSDFMANLAEAGERPAAAVPLLSEATLQRLHAYNATFRELPEGLLLHGMIEAQVDRTPDAIAVAYQERALSYRALDEAGNRLARRLVELGVGPDVPVGIHVERSIELVVAALGVLKAGGAYVPLDPAYPKDRIQLMIDDAKLRIVITESERLANLAASAVQSVVLDQEAEALRALSSERLPPRASPSHLAYIIYTSGSTGKPKGVMVEHQNVVNFFYGMDERIPHGPGATWLAVTSLSFDISVLELFWTLARGFKVVVHKDQARAAAGQSRYALPRQRPLDFSLFYFSADAQAEGSERYRLLLDGARFADEHGFSAVWTPERHFHAFGGLYPNPAVTGAAVAAITKHVKIRAGSVVLPLHHPIRVAEAWSVVDNISNGRVGISVASGWQPNDFVLMPQNYKSAKAIMMRDVEVVRKLWRGETVSFPGPSGEEVKVRTLPEPVQKELPVWITTAGNAETFEMAGAAGANVLTHLLGQSVEKLAPKIAAYRAARAKAGFDPNTGVVSLMLHTFVGPDRAAARDIVRGPLKAYLATSMDLIKDKAWVFPAFARPKGMKGDQLPGGNELAELSEEDRDGLLEAAFERYFETSGLFGTVDDAYAMSQTLKAIGVDDVACLIDFGVPTQVVLDHLPFLDQVRAREQTKTEAAPREPSSESASAFEEHPLLTDVRTHAVTHLQCTPSMARMFLGFEETRAALAQVQHLYLGGEALPKDLVDAVRACSRCSITNMYGPTETTVWSSTHEVQGDERNVPIGRPIANTQLLITDEKLRLLPPGVAGELSIGGLGVTRGYFERPELTAERFVPDPFSSREGARLYRTGDRARLREDGLVDFLGRADFQVKLRGYRIELGEIEALIRAQPGVMECVVVVREDKPGDQRLVAYVVAAPRTRVDGLSVREALRASLPEYMVPSTIVPIAELPLTPNRKIDRKALPAPELSGSEPEKAAAPPESEVERAIAEVWQDMLGREVVGVEDNFFDLGGHSLLVVRLHRKLQEVLGRALSLTDLYRFPTIRSLSNYLTAGSSGDNRKASERGARRRELLQRRGR